MFQMQASTHASQTTAEPRVECTGSVTHRLLRTPAVRTLVADFVAKLLQCLENNFTTIAKNLALIVNDMYSCFAKAPQDFFKCMNKAEMPRKLTEIINSVMDTANCVMLSSSEDRS